MRKCFWQLGTAAALISALAGTASAQTTTTVVPPYEVGVAYQVLRTGEVCDDQIVVERCLPDRAFPFGLNFDVVRNFGTIGLGVVGELGFSRDSEDDVDFNAFNFGVGVRWTGRVNPTFSPYGQLLIGGVRTSFDIDVPGVDAESSTDFMLQPGGGVNFMLNERVNVFGQVDVRRVSVGDVDLDDDNDIVTPPLLIEDASRTDFRVLVGIRFGIGVF